MSTPIESSAPATAPTHEQLVEVAARWLRKSRGCSVVLAELVSALPEIPDAIGWRCSDWSILIECKTSRADFRKDAKKLFRTGDTSSLNPSEAGYFVGVGQERYYLAPKGMLSYTELPTGWGLLEWDGKRVRVIFQSGDIQQIRDRARSAAEVVLLVSGLRRHQQAGMSAALLAIGELDKEGVRIARKTLERRARALAGLPEVADDEPVIDPVANKEAVI